MSYTNERNSVKSLSIHFKGCSTAPLEGRSPSGIAAVEAVLLHNGQTHSVDILALLTNIYQNKYSLKQNRKNRA